MSGDLARRDSDDWVPKELWEQWQALRAKVQTLRNQHGPGRAHDHEYTYPCSRCDALEEVLALFDGGSE